MVVVVAALLVWRVVVLAKNQPPTKMSVIAHFRRRLVRLGRGSDSVLRFVQGRVCRRRCTCKHCVIS